MHDKKIKIMMLSAGALSGAFRMMLDIISYIDKRSFTIYICYKPEFAEWQNYEIDLIRSTGCEVVSLRGKWLFDIRGFLDLWRFLKKEKIDILHSWDVLGVPARIICKLSGAKILEEWANPPPVLFKEISLKHYLINKITSPLVDAYVACSHGVMDKYKSKRPVIMRNKLLSVVYNSVDVSRFQAPGGREGIIKKKYGISDNAVILTSIGHFNEQKAQSDLLEAYRTVSDKRKDAVLILAGWGPLQQKLENLAHQLGIMQNVIFTGKLSQEQVIEVLAITDLFVLSSHWEGFGLVLAEAMAASIAVVSTNTDGACEVVEDGKTGMLVPIGNPQMIAEAALGLLENPETMDKMGQAGFERVSRLFNTDRFIKGYETAYQSLLK